MKRWKKPLQSMLIMLVALVFILPVLWAVVCSFKFESDILRYPPRWLVKAPTLENYAMVFQKFDFLRWIGNTLYVSLLSCVVALMVQACAAYALGKLRFRGHKLFFGIMVAMLFIPIQAYVIPLYLMFSSVSLTNTYASLVLPSAANVTGVYLLKNFFQELPSELDEAAFIDGAGEWRIFLQIVLPLSQPVLASVSLLSFVSSWNNFLWPMITIGSAEKKLLSVGLSQFMGVTGGAAGAPASYGMSLAAGFMAIIPTLILFLALQRFFVEGIVSSGIKG